MRLKPFVLWTAAALLAVGASSVAVSAATTGTGHDVLSPSDVDRALAGGAPVVPGTSPMPSASTTSPDGGQAVTTPGGVVVVSCGASGPTLLRWAPKPGYRVDHTVDAVHGQVSVVFETDGDNDVIAVIRCVAGKAEAALATGGDDHGGRGGATGGPTGDPTDDDHGGGSGPH